ncbi:hypothetical protein DFH27DRAFT_514838 [Peziza echinospora]|nr:hypothetical protein DFH27DRAFT_514838 [Peziza echinospora]
MTAVRRIPLHSFLLRARSTLKSSLENSRPLNIVTGNESVDLDSFASSILFAYLSPPHQNLLPILPIPRADLNLRPEFLYVLKELSIPSSSLIFLDDIPANVLHPRPSPPATPHTQKNNVVLVDHNVLQAHIFHPSHTVVKGIIDHHTDEGHSLDAVPRIIDKAGSCSALVTEYFQGKWPAEDSDEHEIDGENEDSPPPPPITTTTTTSSESESATPQYHHPSTPSSQLLAKLALAPLLIDTSNLRQRVTPHDTSALSFLESKLPPTWSSAHYFKSLNTAKSSLDGLSLRDILRKDYKEWRTTSPQQLLIGISSSVKPLEYILSRADGGDAGHLLGTLRAWAQERSLDVVAVMTAFVDPEDKKFKRQLLVWVVNETEKARGYLERFEAWAGGEGELGLVEVTDGGLGQERRRKVWIQGNVDRSRKEVAPGMRGC